MGTMSQQYLIQVVNIGLVHIEPSFTTARTWLSYSSKQILLLK